LRRLMKAECPRLPAFRSVDREVLPARLPCPLTMINKVENEQLPQFLQLGKTQAVSRRDHLVDIKRRPQFAMKREGRNQQRITEAKSAHVPHA
jgi:hypothetical protein